MKTQVIQLDPHDDVISIKDKMAWAKTPRILLVFPRRKAIRLRNLDLRLLHRHAEHLGAELAFVSRSGKMRKSAREEGIPFFRVISVAQRRSWPRLASPEIPAREEPPADLWQMRREVYSNDPGWQDRPTVRVGFFAAAVVAVLVLLVLFLPSASIQLKPQTRLQSLQIAVSAGPNVTQVNLAGSVPARSLSTFLEKSQAAPATGQMVLPDGKAAGKVQFRNLTDASVTIPAGTVVRTTGDVPIRFEIQQEAVVEAAGKTVEVPAQAVNGGRAGNVAADTLVAIEGDLGASLAVTNLKAMTGGTEKTLRAPNDQDRSLLRNALQKQILGACRESFQQMAGEGALLFPDTLKVAQVTAETYLPADGQAGDNLSLTLNIRCEIKYASAADLRQLAGMGLDVNVPEGWQAVPDAALALVSGAPVTDAEGATHWTLDAQRLLQASLDPERAVDLARGHTPKTAVQILSAGLPVQSAPVIRLRPSWWPRLPVFPFRITVSLEN